MTTTLAGSVVLAEGGPFDLINGIPVHPLVVHAAVVLVPLSAIGLVVMAVSARFSRRLGWLVTLGAAVAAGASFVAKEAGEALESRVGAPGFDHASLGDQMPVFSVVLLVATLALWLIDRSAPAEGPSPRRGLRIGVAVVAMLVALGNLVWIYRVGDSGAKSVWSEDVAASDGTGTDGGGAAAEPGATASATPSGTASAGATAGVFTLATVATHATESDCWAAINGNVYDLTAWIEQHPGGKQRIIDICGKDGSAAYDGQHDGDRGPAKDLAGFEIGTLGTAG